MVNFSFSFDQKQALLCTILYSMADALMMMKEHKWKTLLIRWFWTDFQSRNTRMWKICLHHKVFRNLDSDSETEHTEWGLIRKISSPFINPNIWTRNVRVSETFQIVTTFGHHKRERGRFVCFLDMKGLATIGSNWGSGAVSEAWSICFLVNPTMQKSI